MSARALTPTRLDPARSLHPAPSMPAADPVAHEIGRDFARHGLSLPEGLARVDEPLWCGWQIGRAAQVLRGQSPWPADERTRRWLHLRLQASLRGIAFESCRVTPHLVGRLDTRHCPVTRRRLDPAALTDPTRAPHPDDARLVTLDGRRGIDAGLLVMLSRRAAAALDSHDLDDLDAMATRDDVRPALGRQPTELLDAAECERLATLLSFVTPMSHHEAAQRPLRVLPPNRLALAQPVQVLQALLSRLLLRSGWTARLQGWQALLPHAPQREALQRFFLALLARVLEAGHAADPLQRRWAIEDAWRDPEVLRLWTRLALQLDAAGCSALVERAAARGLCDTAVLCHPDDDAPAEPFPPSGHRPVRLLPPLRAPSPAKSPAKSPATPARPLIGRVQPPRQVHPVRPASPTPHPGARRLASPVQLSLPWAA